MPDSNGKAGHDTEVLSLLERLDAELDTER